jgi:hypothetical protein
MVRLGELSNPRTSLHIVIGKSINETDIWYWLRELYVFILFNAISINKIV